MTKTTAVRMAVAAGVLGIVGGALGVIGGSPQGWVAIICGVGIAALAIVENRRSRP
jgi:hypothetical protein